MKHFMKLILAVSLIGMTACKKAEKEVVEEPVEVEKEQIKESLYYKSPVNPTDEQITLFNELSTKKESGTLTPEEEATLVAKNFSMQFFTFEGKTGRDNVGGMMYIPSRVYDEFKDYAQAYFYSNFELLAGKHGNDNLPSVTSVEVNEILPEEVLYRDNSYEGYALNVTLTYKDNKSSQSGELKTTYKIVVFPAQDYKDYDAYKEYINSLEPGELADPEHETAQVNDVFRVFSISE